MFAKPYKLKSYNSLKNSEKKQLAKKIQDKFPCAGEDKVKELVPVKSSCMCMELVLHSGDLVGVYAVDGVPVMIETEDHDLVPTVCALWKVPRLVPSITIHTPVLSKIQGGAPLYLPGVVIPPEGIGFPVFQRLSVVAVNTGDNSAAGVIGRVTMSSAGMLLRAAGICLETLHFFGDLLCKDSKFVKLERPKLGAPAYEHANTVTDLSTRLTQINLEPEREEWPALGRSNDQQATPASESVANEPALLPEPQPAKVEPEDHEMNEDFAPETESADSEEVPSDMEGLLKWTLIRFIRLHANTIQLPLKTNLLYKNYLIPLVPTGEDSRVLDVKKSSYKKMGKFLEAMQQEGLVEVREIEKGVDAIVSVNREHPAVRAHRVSAEEREKSRAAPAPDRPDYDPPVIQEVYCVTACVMDLFHDVKKGTPLSPTEIRNALTEYVKSRELHRVQRGVVSLDATLAAVLRKQEQEVVKWDALMEGVQARMTPSTLLRFRDGTEKLSKARMPAITMQVQQRSGNKKVTLVSNLEAYGFDLSEMSRMCQLGVAASCGITRSPGSKTDQLLLQGDQTHFMAKLLIERFGLPKKYVEGADKALQKKK